MAFMVCLASTAEVLMPLWTFSDDYPETKRDYGMFADVDSAGNLYTVGWAQWVPVPESNDFQDHFWIYKHAIDGRSLWKRRIEVSGYASDMAVAPDGAVYVIVTRGGSPAIGTLVKYYSSSGFAWGVDLNAVAGPLKVDRDGNATLLYSFDGASVRLAHGREAFRIGAAGHTMGVASFTPSGTLAQARELLSGTNHSVLDFALDDGGGITVLGRIRGHARDTDYQWRSSRTDGDNVYVSKFDRPSGKCLWLSAFDIPLGGWYKAKRIGRHCRGNGV